QTCALPIFPESPSTPTWAGSFGGSGGRQQPIRSRSNSNSWISSMRSAGSCSTITSSSMAAGAASPANRCASNARSPSTAPPIPRENPRRSPTPAGASGLCADLAESRADRCEKGARPAGPSTRGPSIDVEPSTRAELSGRSAAQARLDLIHHRAIGERGHIPDGAVLCDVTQEAAHDLARAGLGKFRNDEDGTRARDRPDLLGDV